MTDAEFQEFGAYLTKLWPKFTMTTEQRDIWRAKFGRVTIFDARQAAANVMETSRYATPRMGEITEALRKVRVASPVRAGNDEVDQELREQVAREEAEEAAEIAEWTDQEREDGRREILRRERGMAPLIGKCGVRSPMLTHFLVERFVHHRATVFPGKITVRRENRGGKEVRIGVRPAGVQISVDEYWKA